MQMAEEIAVKHGKIILITATVIIIISLNHFINFIIVIIMITNISIIIIIMTMILSYLLSWSSLL